MNGMDFNKIRQVKYCQALIEPDVRRLKEKPQQGNVLALAAKDLIITGL